MRIKIKLTIDVESDCMDKELLEEAIVSMLTGRDYAYKCDNDGVLDKADFYIGYAVTSNKSSCDAGFPSDFYDPALH